MNERESIDIFAIVEKNGERNWRSGWLPAVSEQIILRTPQGQSAEFPIYVKGVPGGLVIPILDVLVNLTPDRWDMWRSNS